MYAAVNYLIGNPRLVPKTLYHINISRSRASQDNLRGSSLLRADCQQHRPNRKSTGAPRVNLLQGETNVPFAKNKYYEVSGS